MKRSLSLPAVIAFLAIILSALPVRSIEHKYFEEFSTTRYKDSLNTTAWWDTVAGELKLFPFVSRIAGNYNTPGFAWGVVVSGDYAFVADYGSGLQVIDISDLTNPSLLGSYDTPGSARDIVVSGDLAFVADDGSGLQVIDVSDPTNPTLAGTYDTPGSARGVAVSGDHVFVADHGSGLQVIDISDPKNPTLAGNYDTPGWANSVTVSGDHAYVADNVSGLQVIDISDPTNPSLTGNYDTPGTAYGVAVSGDHAFVADWYSGLQVIDISDPTNPTLLGNCDTPGIARDIVVSGDLAFVADFGSSLQMIDISDPTNPSLLDNCATPDNTHGVAVSGEHAFVADYGSGLQVIEISCHVYPSLEGNYDTPGGVFGVTVSGDHAYVADYSAGLQVIDISDPANPSITGHYATPSVANDVSVSGDHAYVANHGSGLTVIDISDPTNPTLAGTYDTPGTASGVAVSGNHAFVADWGSGLQVIDISDPTNPSLAGSYDTPGSASSVTVSGDYAFVADYSSGLTVIDITDPTNPTLAGTYDTPDYARGVTVSGDFAYVADGSSGLQVIDITDPTNPTLAGSCDTFFNAYGVAVSGDYAFVTDNTSGLQVIDISDPTNPTLEGTCDTPGWASGVTVAGDYAFVGDNTSGLQVIRVFGREFYPGKVGRSLVVDESDDTILRARLTATQTDSVNWELSADGGANWQWILPDGSWNAMLVPGTDLLWRSTHTWLAPEINPGVTQLEIEWLVEPAMIDSIIDVPDDQGGWVRINFTRSGYDRVGEETYPISTYDIYRRIDDPLMATAILDQGKPANADAGELRISDDTSREFEVSSIEREGLLKFDDCYYLVSGTAEAVAPPGIWEVVGNVSARQEDNYICLAPTLADSSSTMTCSVYFIAAHTTTPSVFFDSMPDSGYSVDNIAPGVPLGMAVAYNTGSGNDLSWNPSPETDFQYYRVYRGDSESFIPGPGSLVHETATPAWNDPEYDGWDVHYKVTALDYAGNESDPASAISVTGDDTPSVPKTFALYQNVPNPFNPVTTIRFDLPQASLVKLSVFNVKGELVATIVDSHISEGYKEFTWKAEDGMGRAVSSGIYFYRLVAGDFVQTKKMVLLR